MPTIKKTNDEKTPKKKNAPKKEVSTILVKKITNTNTSGDKTIVKPLDSSKRATLKEEALKAATALKAAQEKLTVAVEAAAKATEQAEAAKQAKTAEQAKIAAELAKVAYTESAESAQAISAQVEIANAAAEKVLSIVSGKTKAAKAAAETAKAAMELTKMAEKAAAEALSAMEEAEKAVIKLTEMEEKAASEELSAMEAAARVGSIEINELITVRELAAKMDKTVGDLLKKLMSMGSLATINQRLDTDIAILLANEFKFDVKLVSIYSDEENIGSGKDDSSKLKMRAPIVTIMGHVDHGKTSLLDAIRKSDVVGGEYGGITQHIGAYRVKMPDGKSITFLDTPGHEAFTAMRSRGAQITDIVILVVSAADGTMPQTIEAINHAKDANVPIIVAVNKIDLPTSDAQKIRQELSSYGLLSEEWGGDTIMVDISAKKRMNIELLLENILIKAEIMELKANPDRAAEGIVIEAKLDSRKGPVATLLIEKGTLKVGDNIVVGVTYGKIRAMSDERGKRFSEARPSVPVEVLGINNPPQAGDKFIVVEHEYQAREIAEARFQKAKTASLTSRRHLSLEDINAGKTKDLRIILKADVQGSLGALSDALERLSTNEINLKIVHRGAGSITASDVDLAVASDALIVGFNLRPDASVEKLAEEAGVSINVYRIIYDLVADVKAAMEGLLDPDLKERILGKAAVKQVFKLSSSGVISGCSVTEGKITRNSKVRLLRDNAIVFEGVISSLKRFKDDVKEVEKGFECGIGLENFSDIKTGDIIECFVLEKIARKL